MEHWWVSLGGLRGAVLIVDCAVGYVVQCTVDCASDNTPGFLRERSHLIYWQHYELGTIMPILLKRKLGLRKVESPPWGLTAGE